MKKCFLMMVVLGAFAASADDSYLYWMVDTDDGTAAKFDYNTVQVRAFETAAGVDSGNYLTLYYGNGNEAGMSNGDTIQFATGGKLLNVYTYNAVSGKWGFWNENNLPDWVDAPTIPAGSGFWYVSKGGAVTFGW